MEEPWWFNRREEDNGYCTKTSRMQHECEDECYSCLQVLNPKVFYCCNKQIATPIQKELALKNGLIDEKDEVLKNIYILGSFNTRKTYRILNKQT